MIWHTAPLHEVLSSLNTSVDAGLPVDRQSGDAVHNRSQKPPSFMSLLRQMIHTPAHIALLVGIGVAVGAAVYDTVVYGQGNPWQAVALVVLAVVHALLCTAPVYFLQKHNADAVARKAYTARVRRNGQVVTIPAEAVMPGDIVILRDGDIVAADCRLIDCHGVYCDETAIDGAPKTDEKRADIQLPVTTPFGARINMVYTGCTVLSGHGTAVAVQTGGDTRAAQLTVSLGNKSNEAHPDGTRLLLLRRYAAIAAGILSAATVLCGVIWHMGIPAMLLAAASVSFAILSSASTAAVTWVRYATALRCRANGTVLCTSEAADKAAAVTMVCLEQSLSMTHNRPLLVRIATSDDTSQPGTPLSEQLHNLLQLAVMSTVDGAGSDATDYGIRNCASRSDASYEKLLLAYPCEAVLPYDAVLRRTATVHLINGCHTLIVRGDPSLLAVCEMSEQTADALHKTVLAMQKEGLQVQVVACRILSQVPAMLSQEDCQSGCFAAGLLGFRDELCHGAAAAVCAARRDGVRTVMFSDASPTALQAYAAALKLDMWGGIHSGNDIRSCTDEQLHGLLDCSVWYDVSSQDRVRLIEAWKRAGYTVAVQGTTMEELSVMRAADLCVVPADNSADAARQAADILQTDTEYTAVVSCIRSARSAAADRDGSTVYHLACTLGIALAAFLPMAWGNAQFSLVQVVLLLILVGGLQAAAVVLCPENRDSTPRSHGILRTLSGAALILAAALLGGIWGGTAAYFAAASACIFSVLCSRSIKPFNIPSPGKHLFLYIVGAAALLLAAVPLFIASCSVLTALYAAATGLAAAIVTELIKLCIHISSKKEE